MRLPSLFGRKPYTLPPLATLAMLPTPEQVKTYMFRSRMDAWMWYSVIYILATEPDITTNKLAMQLGISWITADNMRKKISNHT